MEKFVVYLNRFNEVKPYKIKIIFEVGDNADIRDLEENKNKLLKDQIYYQYIKVLTMPKQKQQKFKKIIKYCLDLKQKILILKIN